MACECLEDGRRVRCRAVDGELVPSLHERERYCRSDGNFTRCPTFQAFRRNQRRLAQAEYYALWTEPELPAIAPQPPARRLEPGKLADEAV
jgi:hypothetical protein